MSLRQTTLAPLNEDAKRSRASKEFEGISVKCAQKTLDRLINGYKDKSGSSYPPASITETGCILASKAANRSKNGHIQIAPIAMATSRSVNGIRKLKPCPQNAHRLAVLAYKSQSEVDKLLRDDNQASLTYATTPHVLMQIT